MFDNLLSLKHNEVVRRNSGFTLIELILVMAIIGILAVVGIGSYTQATVKSKDTVRKNDLNQMTKALESFNNDVGRYPKTDADGNILCLQSDGTDATCVGLIYAYIGSERAVYMDSLPVDPGNSTRKYVYIPSGSYNSYSLYTALENPEDKDVVVDAQNKPTTWDVNCGVTTEIKCNYRLTETGLVKIKK